MLEEAGQRCELAKTEAKPTKKQDELAEVFNSKQVTKKSFYRGWVILIMDKGAAKTYTQTIKIIKNIWIWNSQNLYPNKFYPYPGLSYPYPRKGIAHNVNQTRVFLVYSYQQPTLAASKLAGDHYAGNQQNRQQEPPRKKPLKPLETTEGPGKGHHDLRLAPTWPKNHQDKPKPNEYRIYQEHIKNKKATKKYQEHQKQPRSVEDGRKPPPISQEKQKQRPNTEIY